MPFLRLPHKNKRKIVSLQDMLNKNKKERQAQAIKTKEGISGECFIFRKLTDEGRICCIKRALCRASFPALMTVEAAVVLPVFLLAILTFTDVANMMEINRSLLTQSAQVLYVSGAYGSAEGYGTDDLLTTAVLQLSGTDAGFSRIDGDTAGFDYWGSSYDADTGKITLAVSCEVLPLYSMFGIGSTQLYTQLQTRAYIGGKQYSADSASAENGVIVYVAANGVVYHTTRSCAYLDLSLHAVTEASLDTQRNAQGGRYYACELCGSEESSGVVYITENGTRYHTTSFCSSISRTVYTMILTDDIGLPGCSRCTD